MKKISTFVKEKKEKYRDLKGYFRKTIQLKRLEKYNPIIDMVLTEYDKKSVDETMMIKSYRKSCPETTNRKTHMEDQACIAVEVARKIGLNEKIVATMAKHHDIGHTFLGHSGEWWISNVKEDYGIGYSYHNSLGSRELIYSKDIYNEIIDRIQRMNPKVSKKELKRVKKSLWLIIDAINSHNGERPDKQSIPNFSKTEEEFENEILNCHTKKKFDKEIEPATSEAALMKICDKISYIPSDMVDGIREGFITGLDDEYIKILVEIGVTKEEIDMASKSENYDMIAKKIKDIFAKDLAENSSKTKIKMSDRMTTLMYKLLDKNNREIVNYVLMKEDLEIYPDCIRKLIDKYSEQILENDLIEKVKNGNLEDVEKEIKNNKGTMKASFWKHIYSISKKDLEFTTKIVKEATRNSIKDELEIAQKVVRKEERYEPSTEMKNKNERIKKYILYYQNKFNKGNYEREVQQEDIDNIYNRIEQEDVGTLHLGMKKRIAVEIASQYISRLSDSEFMRLLIEEKMISSDQYERLTRKYKDINLKEEAKMQSNWVSIEKSFEDVAKGKE